MLDRMYSTSNRVSNQVQECSQVLQDFKYVQGELQRPLWLPYTSNGMGHMLHQDASTGVSNSTVVKKRCISQRIVGKAQTRQGATCCSTKTTPKAPV